jgi:hypothetical protein
VDRPGGESVLVICWEDPGHGAGANEGGRSVMSVTARLKRGWVAVTFGA